MEWEKYTAQPYDKEKGWNNECRPLETVFHVAHVEIALRILKDNKLKAGLVFNKSLLNDKRILVNWLSPNIWHDGFRYGNIGFEIDFINVIKDKKYYWVEIKAEYGITALRILITSQTYPFLTPYDPEKDRGPWRYDSEINLHYWNNNYTLEFMFDGDMQLNEFKTIRYFDHHEKFCCIDPQNCRDKEVYDVIARNRFIARIMAEGLNVETSLFTQTTEGEVYANDSLKAAIGALYMYAVTPKQNHPTGEIEFNDEQAVVYLQALLFFFALKQTDDFVAFMKFFKSQDDFRGALVLRAKQVFKLTNLGHLNWPPATE